VLSDQGINHAATLDELAKSAVAFAEAGADGISPSDMMVWTRGADFAWRRPRKGFDLVPIMSYSTSSRVISTAPFVMLADSAPQFGDRRHYQPMCAIAQTHYSSRRCAEEGADLLMVKPA